MIHQISATGESLAGVSKPGGIGHILLKKKLVHLKFLTENESFTTRNTFSAVDSRKMLFSNTESKLSVRRCCVDDMLVKCSILAERVDNSSEVFKVLRAHWMRVNPKKCAFKVRDGKF